MQVIEQVTVPSAIEVVPISVTVASLWLMGPEDRDAPPMTRAVWCGPSGEPLLESDELQLSPDKKRCRIMNEFRGLKIAGQGQHEFRIDYRAADGADWEPKAQVPVDILFEQGE